MESDPAFCDIASSAAHDLELLPALLAICVDTYPGLDAKSHRSTIERMAEDLRRQLKPGHSPRRILQQFGTFIYHTCRFSSVEAQPGKDTFLLTSVLDHRCGSCLGLTVLYLVLGGQLSLPLHGVLARGHIFVRFDDGNQRANAETTKGGADYLEQLYRGQERELDQAGNQRPYLRNLSNRELLAVVLSSRAGHLYAAGARYREAEKDITLALSWFPNLPDALLNRGILQAVSGDLENAVDSCSQALAADPLLAGALQCRAEALHRLGRKEEAAEDERRYAKLQSPADPAGGTG
jgi:regulator of sirC expression with transglutaminase-like and TPR domain